jgi:hypothetical protein
MSGASEPRTSVSLLEPPRAPRPDEETDACWRAVAACAPDAADRSAALRKAASRRRDAPLVVEATALEALARLARGETARGLSTARTAVRMAQTEGLVGPAALAALALARARRFAGKPHLAQLILRAPAMRAEPRWGSFRAWELLLAGGDEAPGPGEAPPVTALHGLLEAARAGARDEFDASAVRLDATLGELELLRPEATQVIAGLDLARPAPPDLAAWRAGRAQTPAALHGLCADDVGACVLVGPRGPAGRLPARAIPLNAGGTAQLLTGAQARTATALAVLALAGPEGLDRDAFFSGVYGYAYVPEDHKGMLDLLVHRARQTLGALGALERRDAHLVLHVRDWLAIPDPRSAPPQEGRIVRLLASAGATSTGAAAGALALPERTARALLRNLVAEGVCRERRQGREVRYELTDTTFSDETTTRA